MVLENPKMTRLVALVCLFALGACMSAAPAKRLKHETSISVAVVHDYGSTVAEVPRALTRAVEASLTGRNLRVLRVASSKFRQTFVRKRASRDRLASISGSEGDAPLVLLVETRARYFSQINGRFRWTVYVKLSLARRGRPESIVTSSFSVPVLLTFDHERAKEALAEAASTIGTKLGKEVDRFVAGLDLKLAAHLDSGRPSSSRPSSSRLSSSRPSSSRPSSSRPSSSSPALGPIYFVMIDRFANGNRANDGSIDLEDPQAFHGGDIAGLTEHLDRIAAMGFKTIWLSPVFSMRTEKIGGHGAFHGYWTDDLHKVEPRFGTWEELSALRDALKARGMNIVLDVVLNHVGYNTHLLSEHPDWFHHNGDIKNWDDPVEMTTFDVHGLPDLAQEKKEVYDYLLSASAHWIEVLHPIGFRLDAVKHVGSAFWTRYTRALRAIAGPDFATIGELYNGDPRVLAASFREDGFSNIFDFPLYFSMKDVFCDAKDLGRLAATLSLDRLYDDANQLVTFADNHDVPRLWSACGKDLSRARALLTFMLTARGVVALSYGTEVGLEGMSEPGNRGDMKFDAPAVFTGLITKLLAARGRHEVLRTGRNIPLSLSEKHYSYLRVGDREVALIAVNMGSEIWEMDAAILREAHGVDVVSRDVVRGRLALAPRSTRALIFKRNEVSVPPSSDAKTSIVVSVMTSDPGLLLVGAGPELGDWNPVRGVKPQSRRGEEGLVEFRFDAIEGSVSVFKFVSKGNKGFSWESGSNRYFFGRGARATVKLSPRFSRGAEI